MPPPTLDTIARLQHGVLTRAQLDGLGWSTGRIARAVARGDLVRVAPAVYRLQGAPTTRRSELHTALLAVGDDAVLSHWTAAEVLGLTDRTSTSMHLTVPIARRGPSVAGVRMHRTRELPRDAWCQIGGLRVTVAVRTIRDLAATAGHRRLAELMAAAIRTRRCTVDELAAMAESRSFGRGVERFRRALALVDGDGQGARSDAEVAAATALVEAGLPRPVLGHRIVAADGALLAEVDLAYPDLKIAIEIDGYRWHSSPARKQRDERRRNALVRAGWTVLHFTAAEVLSHPNGLVQVVRDLRAVLAPVPPT